jgi:hypothetical protein
VSDFIFRRLPGESHMDRLRRLVDVGAPRVDIARYCGATAAELDEVGAPRHNAAPFTTSEAPPLRKGRQCWLEPVGIVTTVQPCLSEGWWTVRNKWGQEINVSEAELQPLGVAA